MMVIFTSWNALWKRVIHGLSLEILNYVTGHLWKLIGGQLLHAMNTAITDIIIKAESMIERRDLVNACEFYWSIPLNENNKSFAI